MRFLWNFFFFGILFYLIWYFFPEAFNTLVSWATTVVHFFRDLIMNAYDKVQHNNTSTPPAHPAESVKSLIHYLGL